MLTAAEANRPVPAKSALPQHPSPPPATKRPAGEPAPIFVMPGPNGVVIASEDTAALDEFQRLLDTLTNESQSAAGGTTVFYLKHAKASQAAETLERILAGTATAPVASAAAAPTNGGTAGAAGSAGHPGNRHAAGGRPPRRGPHHARRAAQRPDRAGQSGRPGHHQAGPRILDQKEGPEEVAIAPKPRLIPVFHKDAQEIADHRPRGLCRPHDPGPTAAGGDDAALRADDRRCDGPAGRQGRGGFRQGGRSDEQPKLAVSIDAKSNSLIVAAPDPLFQEVKQLVEQLDVMASEQNDERPRGHAARHGLRGDPAGPLGHGRLVGAIHHGRREQATGRPPGCGPAASPAAKTQPSPGKAAVFSPDRDGSAAAVGGRRTAWAAASRAADSKVSREAREARPPDVLPARRRRAVRSRRRRRFRFRGGNPYGARCGPVTQHQLPCCPSRQPRRRARMRFSREGPATMSDSRASTLRFVLFASGVTAIGGFLFGYDTAVINGANSYIT